MSLYDGLRRFFRIRTFAEGIVACICLVVIGMVVLPAFGVGVYAYSGPGMTPKRVEQCIYQYHDQRGRWPEVASDIDACIRRRPRGYHVEIQKLPNVPAGTKAHYRITINDRQTLHQLK